MDKIRMDQGKALNQIKKEKKTDPVDTITAMQEGESSIKKEL